MVTPCGCCGGERTCYVALPVATPLLQPRGIVLHVCARHARALVAAGGWLVDGDTFLAQWTCVYPEVRAEHAGRTSRI